jgi:hypothetical protein
MRRELISFVLSPSSCCDFTQDRTAPITGNPARAWTGQTKTLGKNPRLEVSENAEIKSSVLGLAESVGQATLSVKRKLCHAQE